MAIVDFLEDFVVGFQEHIFSQQAKLWAAFRRDLWVGFRTVLVVFFGVWASAGLFFRRHLAPGTVVGQGSVVVMDCERIQPEVGAQIVLFGIWEFLVQNFWLVARRFYVGCDRRAVLFTGNAERRAPACAFIFFELQNEIVEFLSEYIVGVADLKGLVFGRTAFPRLVLTF